MTEVIEKMEKENSNKGLNPTWSPRIEQTPVFLFLLRYSLIAALVGILVGSTSAFFLTSLDWVTNLREANLSIVWLLPLGGLIIGLLYYYLGDDIVKGNNQLMDEFYHPRKIIPLKMAPMVLFGTLVTHLFGGSAGREGTAVQMGGAMADQFTKLFKLHNRDRKILLVMGISAGFASVFGTPLAGAIFAIEVLVMGRMRYEALLPSILAAALADYTCHAWGVAHTQYTIFEVPDFNVINFLWTLLVGIIFGLIAWTFSKTTHFWTQIFKSKIQRPPLRPVIGGVVLAIIFFAMGSSRYMGLGIPIIQSAFTEQVLPYDFILKILFTAFTLGAGFKGGEVTPLFFIGATLGNVLVWFVPLPMSLLAGMGFVAVFAGATNTPIACTFMGIELFGAEAGLFIGLACVISYFFSGHTGIYGSQVVGSPKHVLYIKMKSKSIGQ